MFAFVEGQAFIARLLARCRDATFLPNLLGVIGMQRLLVTQVLSFSLFVGVPLISRAQRRAPLAQSEAPNTPDHVITATRSGTVFAKPDMGILIMSIRSFAPIAEEAVAENLKKAEAVESSLKSLGYSPDRYRLSPVELGRIGGPQYGPSVTGVEAYRYVYVFFDGPSLSDLTRLTGQAATAIEALRKAGAVGVNVPGSFRAPAQQAMIIYTVKNSDRWEDQALHLALNRAIGAAQAIAKQMQVQIGGPRSVTTSLLLGRYMPTSGLPELQGLPYRFYSTRSDEVEITANVTVEYNFKYVVLPTIITPH